MTNQQAQDILNQTVAAYDKVAGDFATTRVFAWPEAEVFVPYIQSLQQSSGQPLVIADIGCANGRMVPWVKKQGGTYVGVEPSAQLLKVAAKNYPPEIFKLGSMLKLPMADQSVDVCLLNASLHHLPTPLLSQATQELRRVLRPHGYVLMVNWNLWQPRFFKLHLRTWLGKLLGRSDLGWKDVWVEYSSPDKKTRADRFYHGFTLHELNQLAAAHKFSIQQQHYVYKTNRAHSWNGRNILSVWQKT
ncbi:MAG: class I SAM-dependent methyltransferase [Patescibacteria group bacterium]